METIFCTYKEEQKIKTELEKQRMLKQGYTFLSLENYKNELLKFGLKFEINLKYYNTLNASGSFLSASINAIDETNFSYANICGKFYQEEIKKETQKYKEFREFRQNYFTELKSGHLINL